MSDSDFDCLPFAGDKETLEYWQGLPRHQVPAKFREYPIHPYDLSVIKEHVGGLDKEFDQLFRRAFMSRLIPHQVAESLGLTHVKGILLYGPPGTGKTLLASYLEKILKTKSPKKISGSELLGCYVGDSEKAVRQLFEPAEKEFREKGKDSDLHLVVIDEFDAVAMKRKYERSYVVHDGLVNQLLAKMDGLEQVTNILFVAMTNNKDQIDPALLRPGRFEVQIGLTLPDRLGRRDIFKIHTETLRKNGHLGKDVDLEDLALRTSDLSGADIAAVVRSALSHAVESKIGPKRTKDRIACSEVQVTLEHFNRAIAEVQPAKPKKVEEITIQLVKS